MRTLQVMFLAPGSATLLFFKKIEAIIKKGGGIAYFVHLTADPKILLNRVTRESRKKLNKLRDKKIMKDLLSKKINNNDWNTSADVKHNITIDNSNISPKKVVKFVRKVFSI